MSPEPPEPWIRQAVEADLEAIDRLLIETLWHGDRSVLQHVPAHLRAQVRRDLRAASPEPCAGLLVAVDDGRIVGTIAVETMEALRLRWRHAWGAMRPYGFLLALRFVLAALRSYRPGRDEAHLSMLAVGPGCRGRGLGQRLVRAAEAYALEREKRLAVAFIHRDNAASRAVFGKRGFRHAHLLPRGPFVRVHKMLQR
jgi:ribosomal protein S18 acetylase RimI-like enzyme